MSLRAVLFDLDGTLVDSAPAIALVLSHLREARGATSILPAQVRPWISLGADELVRRALMGCATHVSSDLAEFRRALFSLPTPVDSLYPGVRELLSALQGAGLSLAIVTNKPEGLARKLLLDLDLQRAFLAVVGGDTTARAKPDSAPLLAALTELAVFAGEAVLVGDSAVDASAAAGLAMPFHLFENGYGAAECAGWPVASRFARHADLLPTLLSAAAELAT